MKDNKIALIVASVAVVIAIASFFKPAPTPVGEFGGSTRSSWTVGGALNVTGATALTNDLTVGGGNLVLTTGAGATSTAEVGAIETYATSSATKICVRPSTLGATSTFAGSLLFSYGECPSL